MRAQAHSHVVILGVGAHLGTLERKQKYLNLGEGGGVEGPPNSDLFHVKNIPYLREVGGGLKNWKTYSRFKKSTIINIIFNK